MQVPEEKGAASNFGFLKPGDGSPEVFFHISGFVDDDADEPLRGDVVTYRPSADRLGRAKAIKLEIVAWADEAKNREPTADVNAGS